MYGESRHFVRVADWQRAMSGKKLDSFHFFDKHADALSQVSEVWTIVDVQTATVKMTDTFEFNGQTISMPTHPVPHWKVTIRSSAPDDSDLFGYKTFTFSIGTMVEVLSFLPSLPFTVFDATKEPTTRVR